MVKMIGMLEVLRRVIGVDVPFRLFSNGSREGSRMTGESSQVEANYQRVARELREAILQQNYDEGIPLPTEAVLAKSYNVSRQTVRRAFYDLVAENLVFRVPGRGTFVRSKDDRYLRHFGSIEEILGLSIDTELELLTPLVRRVDISAAGRLRQQQDVVLTAVLRRLHRDIPFCLTTVYLPSAIGNIVASLPELNDPSSRTSATIIGLLDGRLQYPIQEAEQSVTVTTADEVDAEHLCCEVGTPLLRIDRIYYDTKNAPIELAISHFVPERYSYRVRLRRTSS